MARLMNLRTILFFLALPACGAIAPLDATANEDGSSTPSSDTGGVSSSSGAAPAAATCGPVVPARCGETHHVATVEDLVFVTTLLPWQSVSVSKTGPITAGADIMVDVDLELDATLLANPFECPAKPDASGFAPCHSTLLRAYAFPDVQDRHRIPGIHCVTPGDRPVHFIETCNRIAIAAGTTFRMRAVIEDQHPSEPTYWPFIEFERACNVACDIGERRCEASQTCFSSGRSTCAYCDGYKLEVCACTQGCGTMADGESCSFSSAPDVDDVGTCGAGFCEKKH